MIDSNPLKGYSRDCITSEAWCSAERKVTLQRLTSEKTLFFCSRSVPLTLHSIHLHSICELALGSDSANWPEAAAWPRGALRFIGRVPSGTRRSPQEKISSYRKTRIGDAIIV
jgi:hypothetical protein